MSEPLEVWLDCDLTEICQVGTLSHDRGQVRFQYDPVWLQSPLAFAIDPTLMLGKQPYFPKPEQGNFGIFLDSDLRAAPPVSSLRELAEMATQLTSKRLDDLDALRRWLAALVAPAFDVNPNVDRSDHVLNLDDSDNRPDLHTVLTTAPFYGLNATEARGIVKAVAHVVDNWRQVAAHHGIARADIELTAIAFSAHHHFRSGRS